MEKRRAFTIRPSEPKPTRDYKAIGAETHARRQDHRSQRLRARKANRIAKLTPPQSIHQNPPTPSTKSCPGNQATISVTAITFFHKPGNLPSNRQGTPLASFTPRDQNGP